MAKIVSATNNSIIKSIYKLLRDSKSQYIVIENANVISFEFCQTVNVHSLLCTQNWYELNAKKFKIYDHQIIIVSDEIISKLGFTQNAQDVLLVVKYEYAHFVPARNGKYFILDNINDPGNLGTILRNAIAFGFNEIYINQNGVSPLNEKVVRSSMGALLSIKINFYKDLIELVDQLKSLSINIFATALSTNSTPLNAFNYKNNYAIILGNEAHGVDQKHLTYISNNLYIPIKGIDSLNVANACAIIMYHLNTVGDN